MVAQLHEDIAGQVARVAGCTLCLIMAAVFWYNSTLPTEPEIWASWPYTTTVTADAHLKTVKTWFGHRIDHAGACTDPWEFYPQQAVDGETIHASFTCTLLSGPRVFPVYLRLKRDHTWLLKVNSEWSTP